MPSITIKVLLKLYGFEGESHMCYLDFARQITQPVYTTYESWIVMVYLIFYGKIQVYVLELKFS